MSELEWTGERLVTSISTAHGVVEHLHRYALACEIARNKIVLDIASGEGYGSALLSRVANKVYGVDIDEKSVHHAKLKYEKHTANLEYAVGSTSKIPLPENSVDVVISFETLEHHDEHESMMLEIKRVLKPGGKLLISSPEKTIYKDRDPYNPYHIKELCLDDFKKLLRAHFKYNNFFEQKFVVGSLISTLNESKTDFKTYHGHYDFIDRGLNEVGFYNRPFFNLCLSSDIEIQDLLPGQSMFSGAQVIEDEKKQSDLSYTRLLNSTSYRFGHWFVKKLGFLFKRNRKPSFQ